jgi:hypothetical protein
MLLDIDLIQEFVKESLRGREVLLSNHALMAQRVFEHNQLESKTEGVLLTINMKATPQQVLVTRGSAYWELIVQVLADHQFICSFDSKHNKYDLYHYCRVPKGYQIHCTKSVILWRTWWKYRQRITQVGLSSELWIRTRETWYPIRNLLCGQGFIFIQTLGSEVSFHSDDLVTWLSKTVKQGEDGRTHLRQ